ncbi:hypothetical protein H7U34_06645 [Collinsella tanakaei]|nr:hypothetical protein [Collinsella tanakaei]
MKRMNTRVFLLWLLAAACLLPISRSAYALDDPCLSVQDSESSKEPIRALPEFIEMIDGLYDSPERYKVIDKMGNEATERFIARHSAQYGEKDWRAIKEAICDEVAYIIWDTTPAAPRTMLRPTAVKEFYEVIRSNDGKGYGGEAYGTLSITYQLNDSIPKIVGANSPVLSVRYYMGDAMAANTVGVSTWKTISSDGSRLDFGATYSVSMSFAPGFTPIWSGMAGPYSVSSATFA